MGAVARIESTLGFNDAQFTRGIERAEKRAATFSQRVERNFVGMFKRDPSQRAENAVSNLIGDITSGNTSRGLAQFAGRISGLGIIAGVGIGAAIDIFDKLRTSVLEVREAHDQLDKQMSKPLSLTSIDGLGSAIDNLQKKQNTFSHSFTNTLFEVSAAITGTGGELGLTGMRETQEISEAISKRQSAERLRGRNELVRANVLADLGDDPKRKALAEMRFKFDQQRDALRGSPDKGTQERLKALDIEQEQAEKNFKLNKAQRSEEFEDAKKLATLKRMNLTPEREKEVANALKLEATKRKLAGKDLSPEERDNLKLQQFSLETEAQMLKPKPVTNRSWGTLVGTEDYLTSPEKQSESVSDNGQSSVATLLKQLIDLTQAAWAGS